MLSAPSNSREEVPMSKAAGSVTESSLMQNEEYRRLSEEHLQYESRLSVLSAKAVLSDEEQLEESTLKKKKLSVKDRMYSLARQVRGEVVQT
jgi:uncharacterized protein YdcH (DUF465 family)